MSTTLATIAKRAHTEPLYEPYKVGTDARPTFEERVRAHRERLRRRGGSEVGPKHAMPAERAMPRGTARLWFADVVGDVPRSARGVARQIARLCCDDTLVTIPWRSLCDATDDRDDYVRDAVQVLVDRGWLRVETIGKGRGAVTTFYLR